MYHYKISKTSILSDSNLSHFLCNTPNSRMFFELENGDTCNGHLIDWTKEMEFKLKDVTFTSRNGNRTWKKNEFILGLRSIKWVQVECSLVIPSLRRNAGQVKMRGEPRVSQ